MSQNEEEEIDWISLTFDLNDGAGDSASKERQRRNNTNAPKPTKRQRANPSTKASPARNAKSGHNASRTTQHSPGPLISPISPGTGASRPASSSSSSTFPSSSKRLQSSETSISSRMPTNQDSPSADVHPSLIISPLSASSSPPSRATPRVSSGPGMLANRRSSAPALPWAPASSSSSSSSSNSSSSSTSSSSSSSSSSLSPTPLAAYTTQKKQKTDSRRIASKQAHSPPTYSAPSVVASDNASGQDRDLGQYGDARNPQAYAQAQAQYWNQASLQNQTQSSEYGAMHAGRPSPSLSPAFSFGPPSGTPSPAGLSPLPYSHEPFPGVPWHHAGFTPRNRPYASAQEMQAHAQASEAADAHPGPSRNQRARSAEDAHFQSLEPAFAIRPISSASSLVTLRQNNASSSPTAMNAAALAHNLQHPYTYMPPESTDPLVGTRVPGMHASHTGYAGSMHGVGSLQEYYPAQQQQQQQHQHYRPPPHSQQDRAKGAPHLMPQGRLHSNSSSTGSTSSNSHYDSSNLARRTSSGPSASSPKDRSSEHFAGSMGESGSQHHAAESSDAKDGDKTDYSKGRWKLEELNMLLHVARVFVRHELRVICDASFFCGIKRPPRAIDKQLKRLLQYERWAKRDVQVVAETVHTLISSGNFGDLTSEQQHKLDAAANLWASAPTDKPV